MSNSYPDKFDSSNLDIEEKSILAEFFSTRHLFDKYLKENTINLFTCPGCGYPTITERGAYEICYLCNWEDDNQDNSEADEIWAGPNHELSLTEHRLNIGKFLKILTKEGKKINTDQKEVLSILTKNYLKLKEIIERVPENAHLRHSVVKDFRSKERDLFRQLFK